MQSENMKSTLKLFFSLLVLTVGLGSCSKYQKVLKSTDMDAKLSTAIEFFKKEDYYRSQTLLEELITTMRGTKNAEDVYYYYAYCHFYLKEFILANYQFEIFAKSFPQSPRAQECAFMAAYSHYLDSPGPTLDQESTVKAIEGLQLFINKYPKSTQIEKANQLIDNLREKLQTKDYNNAKLYHNISDYKAAVLSFKNLIKEYPETKYKEEAYFLIFKSQYLLAVNSVETKQEERFKDAVKYYYKFIDNFPTSKYLTEAEQLFQSASKSVKLQSENLGQN